MFLQRRAWTSLTAAAALLLVFAVYFAVARYRYRFVRSDSDLLQFLPNPDASLFFANVEGVRRAGYLSLLTAAKPGSAEIQDSDYTRFVRETGFDYARDLNALAGSVEGDQFRLLLRGRFEWRHLKRYAETEGGACSADLCSVPSRTKGRWLSFRAVQPDVMALASGGDPDAAGLLRAKQDALPPPSAAPVWLRPSRAVLTNPTPLPLAVRIFALSLQSADSVVLALLPAGGNGAALAIEVDALFANGPTAETARDQLERCTKALKLELARNRQPAGPAELAGLLTSGTFQVTNRRLTGTWAVRKELIDSLR